MNGLPAQTAAWSLLFLTSVCWGHSPKLAKDLPTSETQLAVDVIVQFADHSCTPHSWTVSRRGGHLKAELSLIGAALCTIPTRALDDLASDPDVRVLDSNGAVTDSSLITAIQRAIQLKNAYNIRVINRSLGRPVFERYALDPFCQAVEQAWNAGIVVVVAAGNDGRNQTQGTDGYATITAPGNDSLVITVGAIKHMDTPSDDFIASYSSKGPTLLDHIVKPDLVAPGNRIISLLASMSLTASRSSVNHTLYSYYQSSYRASTSAGYYRLSGTSMVAAMISPSTEWGSPRGRPHRMIVKASKYDTNS